MTEEQRLTRNQIECLLFIAGDPVPVAELARTLAQPVPETRKLLEEMASDWEQEGRGIQIYLTEDTVQMVSNRSYIGLIETLLQPDRSRAVSRSMLETLAIIAYRQPVTRGDIEEVRGVRCEYTVAQLQKMGLIEPVGRRDTPGKPVLFATTDAFLRKFGLHSLQELPEFSKFSETRVEWKEEDEITNV